MKDETPMTIEEAKKLLNYVQDLPAITNNGKSPTIVSYTAYKRMEELILEAERVLEENEAK